MYWKNPSELKVLNYCLTYFSDYEQLLTLKLKNESLRAKKCLSSIIPVATKDCCTGHSKDDLQWRSQNDEKKLRTSKEDY